MSQARNSKTLFEARLNALNEKNLKDNNKMPKFGFRFVGETSLEAELDLQAKFVLALIDINTLKIV